MNQGVISEEQKTPDDPLSYATMAILARIGKQAEFKEAWERLENAERNYICGDIYNIIKSAHPYNPQAEREKVLDVTLVKILEDFRMLSFNATSQHMEAISLYHAQEIVKQRLGEFVRGGQWG